MGSNLKDDIIHIQEWMKKDPQLPEPFDDDITRVFLHSTYYSLEQTKKCIERFCTDRHSIPQVFLKRDPMARNIELANNLHDTAYYDCGEFGVFFFRLSNDIDNFDMQDTCKALSLKIDCYILNNNRYPLKEKHAVVLDLKAISIKHIPKLNIVLVKSFILYMLESTAVRIKKIFIINAPPIMDTIFNLVKPIFTPNIIEIFVISADESELKKLINSSTLPVDYGGQAVSLRDNSFEMWEEVVRHREMFLDDNFWKGDASKIPKKADINVMNGSFRTLAID